MKLRVERLNYIFERLTYISASERSCNRLRYSFLMVFIFEVIKKSALASGVRPCSGTHTPGSALRAGATRRSPTQCVVVLNFRGRLASLGAVPCGGCMVWSACAIFCAASAVATPVRRRVQRQCLCCVRERSRCLSTTVCSRCRH